MGNPTHCLNIHNVSNKLPSAVVEDIKQGKITELDKHIKALKTEQLDIEAQHKKAINARNTDALKQVPTSTYVNRSEDPNNELNQFRVSGFEQVKRNLVQRLGSIAQVLKSHLVHANGLTEHDQAVLSLFSQANGFGQQFSKTLESIFKPINDYHFRYMDLLQYFPQRDAKDLNKIVPVSYPGTSATSTFDTFMRNVMAATAFEWLNTEGKLATGQTESTLKRMLGMDKDEELSESMKKHLIDLGIPRDRLADQLGKTIYNRLNLNEKNLKDFTAKDKLIRSLGYMTIATMENMTYSDGTPMLKRQELYVGDVAEGFGLKALEYGEVIDDHHEVFYDPSDEQRTKDNDPDNKEHTGKLGKPTQVYIKVESNQQSKHDLHTDLTETAQALAKAPDAFDKIFGNEPDVKTVAWKKIRLGDNVKIGRFGLANTKQLANFQKNLDVPYRKSTHTFSVYQAITGAARDLMLGVQTMDGKLAIRQKSVDGSNRGIARDVQAVDNWLREASTQENGEDTPFFIGAKFMAQMRMLQTGFNPQNSKIVRNLFSPEAFKISFDPKVDTEMNEAFLQSIALAFEVETIKEGGKAQQLKKLQEKLKNEKIAAAIQVLQEFQKSGAQTLTDEQQMIVAKGVKETGSKLHGLKGLVEYARYAAHESGQFETDMYNELDGVSNGVIISMLSLIPNLDKTSLQPLLASLAMGGVHVDDRKLTPNLDELMHKPNLNDAYQRMGQVWALIEAQMKMDFNHRRNDMQLTDAQRQEAETRFNQFLALESLLGRFTEHKQEDGTKINTGVVNSLIRKLSKPRTMQTIYGAGIYTQNKILANESVIDDGIYSAIESIAADVNDGAASDVTLAKLTRLLNTIKVLTSDHSNLSSAKYLTDGKIDTKKLLGSKNPDGSVEHKGFALTPKQIKNITSATRVTYGEAMKRAIEEVYAPVIAARKPFITLVQRAATTYNLVLKAKVEQAIADKNNSLLAELETKKAEVESAKQQIIDAYKPSLFPLKKRMTGMDKSSSEYKSLKEKVSALETKQAQEIAALNTTHELDIKQQLNRLSKEELQIILKSIEHLIPRIKTPFHTESDPSYLYLAKVGKDKDQSSLNAKDYGEGVTVEQSYKGKTPKHKGYVDSIPYLKEVGASSMVQAIQMLDSVFANHAMGIKGVDLLSIHDGFVHGIKDSQKVADALNTSFGEVMFGTEEKPAYSLGEALADMHKAMVEMKDDGSETNPLQQVLESNNIDPQLVIDSLIHDKVINLDVYADTVDMEAFEQELSVKAETARMLQQKFNYQQARTDLMKEAIGLNALKTLEEKRAFLEDLNQRITNQALTMAQEVTKNKAAIGAAVTHIAQYPHNGIGVNWQATSKSRNVLGIRRSSVLKIAGETADINIAEMNKMAEQGIYGSKDAAASTDPGDYQGVDADTRQIDSQNVTQVFDSLLALDTQSAAASVPTSFEHADDIRRILNTIVSKVMKPVQFYMNTHQAQNDETAGAYAGNAIWIQRQQPGQPATGLLGHGIRMSAAVTYAHEMIHHITTFGLKLNADLANQVFNLYEFTRDRLEAKYGDNAFSVFLPAQFATEMDRYAYLNDPANAYEIIAAKERYNYLFNPKQNADKTMNGLDEFLAFGMTDENFKRELRSMEISQKLLRQRKSLFGVFEKNIQTTLVNLYTLVIDFIQDVFHQQKHSDKVGQEIENLVSALAKVDAKNKNMMFSAAADAEARATALGLEMDVKVQNLANKAMNKFQLGRVITKLRQFPEADNMIAHQLRVAMLWYKDQEQGFIPSIINEMQGTTPRLERLHALQAKNTLIIDMAKQDAAKNMAATVRNFFTRELLSHEKVAITKVLLKGDISLLVDHATFDTVQQWVADPKARQAHLDSLFAQIRGLINSVVASQAQRQQYMNFFEGGVQDLAYGIITGEHFKEGKTYLNARNLATMSLTKYENTLNETPIFHDLVSLLDQAASVASLDYTSKRDNQTIAKLMAEQPDAIKNVLVTHSLIKQQAEADLFSNNPAGIAKGYVKTIINPRIQFEQGTLADEKKFADRGFIRQAMPFRRDSLIDPVTDDIYMYISKNGTINDFQAGVMSTTRNKTKGAGSYDIARQLGNTTNAAFVADANNAIALKNVQTVVNNMLYSSKRTKTNNSANTMTPQFNVKGQMVALRYIMSEHAKDTILEQFNEFDSIMGAMAATRIDKLNTPTINAEVVVALREMWDKEKDLYSEAYVQIGPNSPVKRYRDIYENLPPKTKSHIISEWGEPAMMVSRDVIDLVFGQRKYSITEMFEKAPGNRNLVETFLVEGLTFALGFSNPLVKTQIDSPKGRAVTRAKTIEDLMTQLTKLAKGNIIVRSLKVTWGNHVSNVMYLKSKGVPLRQIVLLQREAITSALRYQVDHDKIETLKIQQEVLHLNSTMNAATKAAKMKELDRQIMRLEHMLANNPSTAMIQSGLLPSIVDDINTDVAASPYKFGIEKAIDTGFSKLPKSVERFGRTVFLTEDTEGFKMLNNAVKMTDYVGRYVLYKHYTSKGMKHHEAVSRVSDEFINFAPPTHRMLEYANNIGLVWFSKYQLRVLKHIKNLVKDHPFSALATFILGSTMHHNNILNTIPFVTKNMGVMFNDPFNALTGSTDEILPVNLIDTII